MVDLDQVRLSKVRREQRELKMRSERIERNEIKIFARRASAPGRGRAARSIFYFIGFPHRIADSLGSLRTLERRT